MTSQVTYRDKIAARTRKSGNTVCVGMDPILKKIPGAGSPEEKIKRFYSELLEAMLARNVLPAAVKPNIAYYEAVSLSCLQVLQNLMGNAFKYAGHGNVVISAEEKGGLVTCTVQDDGAGIPREMLSKILVREISFFWEVRFHTFSSTTNNIIPEIRSCELMLTFSSFQQIILATTN